MPRKNPETTIMFVPRTWGGSNQLEYAYYRTYSGNKTPNFSTFASQHRKLPPLPYSVTYHAMTSALAVKQAQYPVPGGAVVDSKIHWYYAVTPRGLATFSTDAQAQAKAIGALTGEMKSMKVNLAQAFAERKQTVGLIASSALRIAKAASSLRKGRLGDAAKSLGVRYDAKMAVTIARKRSLGKDTLASYWLELQYGWKPLLQDIYGALDILSGHISQGDYVHTVRAKATVRDERVLSWENDALYPYANYPIGRMALRHRSQYVINFRMDDQARSVLAATGVTNPALLAWELLPYSFVVDWFLPVGNYLESLETFTGFEFLSGTYTSHKRVTYEGNFSYDKVNFLGAGSYVRRRLPGIYGHEGQMTRQVLTGFPVAGPPSFKNPISCTHAANALALVVNAFSRSNTKARIR